MTRTQSRENAHLALGAYLAYTGELEALNSGALICEQGVAMGRPGRLKLEVTVQGRTPLRVKISGEAVQVFETTLKN